VSRRGNGLSADTYAPLIDVAPELADALLTALEQAGIAAYAAPEEPDDDGDAPLDRLYVDATQEAAAEEILHGHLARLREQRSGRDESEVTDTGGTPAAPAQQDTAQQDEEAIWAQIVAGFDAEPAAGESPWPEQENLAEDDDEDTDAQDRSGRLPSARVIKYAGQEDEEEDLEPDEDGHYVPPVPPPLPSGDPVTKGAWVALVGGPLYLLLTVILGWDVPGWAAFLAVAAFIGGFVALVLRMGDEPRDPDDGAIV
jgi:hypothetical protein